VRLVAVLMESLAAEVAASHVAKAAAATVVVKIKRNKNKGEHWLTSPPSSSSLSSNRGSRYALALLFSTFNSQYTVRR